MADGGVRLIARDPADVATPPAGTATLFPDATNADTPSFKDSSGTTTSFAGATGPAGADGVDGADGADGTDGAGYGGTSATSLAIGTGSKAFTTQAGLAYVAGSRVRAASGAAPDNDWMEGVVSSYAATTLTILVDLTSGSGTHTDWAFTLAGEPPARWLGAWDSGTAYGEGDAVSNDGSSYVCILAHTNQEPPDGTYWDVLAQGAPTEILDMTTAEMDDSLVLAPDGAGGVEFRAEAGGGGGGLARSTVGTTSIGATGYRGNRRTYVKKITLAADAFVMAIVAHVKGDGTNDGFFGGIMFADAAGAPTNIIHAPDPVLTSTSVRLMSMTLNATGRWMSFPVGRWLAAGDYWIGIVMLSGGDGRFQIAYAASGSDKYNAAGNDRQGDSSILAFTDTTDNYSIYADILS